MSATMTLVTAPPVDTRPRRAPKKALPWGSPAVYFVALVVIALMLGPVIYIILGGFRSNSAITVDPAGFPDPWNVENYVGVITSGQFWGQVGNSTMVALATTVGAVALGLAASYVIARYSFRGRGALYALFASGLMFPITVAITPLYIVVRSLGLMNTLPGVILPQIAFALPVTIIILVRELGITFWRLAVAKKRVLPAGRGGKLKTLVQAFAISLALLPLWAVFGDWVHWVNIVFMSAAFILTVWSGIDYLWQAYRPQNKKTPELRADDGTQR